MKSRFIFPTHASAERHSSREIRLPKHLVCYGEIRIHFDRLLELLNCLIELLCRVELHCQIVADRGDAGSISRAVFATPKASCDRLLAFPRSP